MEPRLKRHELEDYVEAQLLEIAESLIPDAPGEEDLKAAKDYFPGFFGGKFPHLGLGVTRTQGRSAIKSRPERPGLLIAEVRIFHPCLPVRGVQSAQDDRTGPAKHITRHLRGLFLEKLLVTSLGRYIEAADSRGGWIDEVGGTIEADYERDKWMIWTDLTELRISA